jgi:ribosome-interacting GTPase 1
MARIEIPKDEKTEELIDSLMEHLAEMKDEASSLRKQGMDTAMADIIIMDIPSKAKMARTTYEKNDIDSVKRSLAQVRHELDMIKTGTQFDDSLQRIQTAYDKIREGDIKTATEIYAGLRDAYKSLPEDERRIVFAAALDIHRRIMDRVSQDGRI